MIRYEKNVLGSKIMKSFIKYFLLFLISLILMFFYLLKSSSGHESLGYLVEDYLSKKTFNEIEVHSLNLEKYPDIEMNLTLNHGAKVFLEGKVDKYNVDMKYHIVGKEFKFNNFHIEEKLELKGYLQGPFSALFVEGKGSIFDGNISYTFTKIPKKSKDIKITMKAVESQKILKFLKQPIFIEGKADLNATFEHYEKHKKLGEVNVFIPKAFMHKVAPHVLCSLKSYLKFNDMTYKYEGKIDSDIGYLNIKNGHYQQVGKLSEAEYDLHLNDLLYFEKILKYRYKGDLHTAGKVKYNNGLFIEGNTGKFGGNLAYRYENKRISLELKALSLTKLLAQFSYPSIFSSSLYGTVNYDMKSKIMLVDTKLRETHFVRTKFSNMIYKVSGIDMLSGIYNESSFIGRYEKNILRSELKIDDGVSYLHLNKSEIDTQTKKINL